MFLKMGAVEFFWAATGHMNESCASWTMSIMICIVSNDEEKYGPKCDGSADDIIVCEEKLRWFQ